ncbi:terminase, ATPase subunit [Klebsiella variicola]|uniref:terminase large subunit domain-containing protein n=1 Tax=Klebsiella/Raoultella group TaxID=2890311 RepID=UPI000D74D3D0|nr:terminase family protein [Klebsiella variicola]WJT90230.1 terminase family protein [Klebsiella pneumoniae]HCF8324198.1 terminase family protein [Klebsiella variicola subsp. variicola]PXH33330.1 terminase [Klebsiella variicola]SXD75647.1 terminase, ATPase subunit [Klebsiella variicola]HBR4053223.1 terminase family protein [Klebsiella pneumoniae]
MAKYSDELRGVARSLYLRRHTPKEIAADLNLPNARIVYYWAEKFSWADMLTHESTEDAIERRIQLLTVRDGKTEIELKELDQLIAHSVKLRAQVNKHKEKMAAARTGTGDSSASARGDGEQDERKRGKYKKNDISGLSAEDFEAWADEHLFGYQKHLRNNLARQVRNILKSRQIGATWYFAFEAFENAVLTGDPQIFLSASRAQAEVFRSYIVNIAQEYFGITLTGNPIRLSNGAELRFLSTNKNTAQSYSGHLYCDEYFWVPNFAKLNEVASAMATHDKWRTTYFSTPSAKTHQAYPFWTGEEWRRGDKKRTQIKFPSEKELRDGGRLCPDEQWRYIITMEDAIAGGFNLASIDKLRRRYNASTFSMLYMCVFVDSKDAVFSFSDLEKCGADVSAWQDHDPKKARPFGDREVWGGYDPARSGDLSTFVIIAPPLLAGEKFRVLAVINWRGMNFRHQASEIKKLFARYKFTYLGVDVTGIGQGVYDNIEHFALRVIKPIRYDLNTKNRLVLKAVDVIESGRIEWDQELKEIPASFMSIRRTVTNSGNAMTFVADRTQETGHAESAWSIMHALDNEPLNYENKPKSKWKFQKAA